MNTVIGLVAVLGLGIAMGCARVQVAAPKDPIKLDVSMRLDIYQHIENDIDAIEGKIKGGEKGQASEKQSFLDLLVGDAYAQELSPEAEGAVSRRQSRHSTLTSWQARGVIGENRSGLVEVRDAGNGDSSVSRLVQEENSDRMVIYNALAVKNGSSVSTVQELYAKRLRADAPTGTPIETNSGWTVK